MKTIQIKPTIGKNDLDRKMKQARGFLEKGKRVRINVYLYGRQRGRPEVGVRLLEEVAEEYFSDYHYSAKPTSNNLSIFYNPKSEN